VTLLSIVREVTGLLSLPQPSVVAASTDRQVIQLFNLLNEEGRDLMSAAPWQALIAEAHFTTVAADTQPAAIPADLDRFIPNSFFNRTTRRQVIGPLSPKEWQALKAQPVYASVYLAYRERAGSFLMIPQPPAGQNIYYEYVSSNWARSATNTPQSAFSADSDTSYLDEHLLGLGLRWRYLKAKGLPYEEDLQTYTNQRDQAIARDGGSSVLSLAAQPINLDRVNLPDGNFGV
jgi:hypothetical protein